MIYTMGQATRFLLARKLDHVLLKTGTGIYDGDEGK